MKLTPEAFYEKIMDILYPIYPAVEGHKAQEMAFLAENSRINHHVEGLDYYCLHRSEELTVKLYLINSATQNSQGFVVHPHNHRYDFATIVLLGTVGHIRFEYEEAQDYCENNWVENIYNFKTKGLVFLSEGELAQGPIELYGPGEKYYVTTSEIHTLKTSFNFNRDKVLLGLIQEKDSCEKSLMYTPDFGTLSATGHPMTVDEYRTGLKMIRNMWELHG